MALSFGNTERAFAHKSDADLSKAYRLFQSFSYPFLVNYGPVIANWAMKIGLPIKPVIKNTIFNQSYTSLNYGFWRHSEVTDS